MSTQIGTSNSSKKRSLVIAEALIQRGENIQWEEFIEGMLKKLELDSDTQREAEKRYNQFGKHVSERLGLKDDDVHVVVQGSMRTQTTIAGSGREKFDLDVVVKLTGKQYEGLTDSKEFFANFGASLKGIEDAGAPEMKNRCWRLQYPNLPFYFDVTPAIPMSEGIVGTSLRVRDEMKVWSPSNPEEFADWFCTIANKRFAFQRQGLRTIVEAKTTIDPIPSDKVGMDDILRRLVQLMKLHRDNFYRRQAERRREAKPISVILVTLASHAYEQVFNELNGKSSSAIEVVMEVVDRMPNFIRTNGRFVVDNPALPGTAGENFADKWNSDSGLRRNEFYTWHSQFAADLAALFEEEYSKRSENRIEAVFGEMGVRAWKSSFQKSGLLKELIASNPDSLRAQPTAPRSTGTRDTLA